MNNQIEIYQTADNQIQVSVKIEDDTVWLNQKQMAVLFEKDSDTIGLHLKNIFSENELVEHRTTEYFAVVQKEGKRDVKRNIKFYNLDAILSVGYRVNSKRGTQFRIWATQRLKDYLVKGYAINEKRLQEKRQEVEYLKTGIRILNRAIEGELEKKDDAMLSIFAKGLELLDDYDHETLDRKGLSTDEIVYPGTDEYMAMIREMYSDFASSVFAQPKDDGFDSSINQIRQSFDGSELYPSLEDKAANLLYLITKNHSFIDGNKRIAAACFLLFLEKNNGLINDGKPIISNEALASLTLFIATSRAEESDIVKRLVISILNRNR